MLFRTNSGNLARLLSSTEEVPANLADVLRELGAGDNRFSGTSFGRGEGNLQAFLQECSDSENGRNLPTDKVPQTTCWLVNDGVRVVGIVRVRHRLNPRLLQYGGHIGYYVRPSERGKGYGRLALGLGLERLRSLGVGRALLTVNPVNTISGRVVLANGGILDGQRMDPVSGEVVDRYWIRLSKDDES
ncbi:MAG TPA: GNAT family N-acetyltransferase [Lacunisphaera sp.]|jgi:predicted acetyltransferase